MAPWGLRERKWLGFSSSRGGSDMPHGLKKMSILLASASRLTSPWDWEGSWGGGEGSLE